MGLRRKRILHIESQLYYAHMLELGLSPYGHEITRVRTGGNAKRYLRGEGKYADRERFPIPDVIVLSLSLPDVHGYKVLAWLQQEPRYASTPVIVHSGWRHPGAEHGALALGAKAFVVKQPDCVALLQALNTASGDSLLLAPQLDFYRSLGSNPGPPSRHHAEAMLSLPA